MPDLDGTLNVIPLDEQLRLAKRRGPMPTKDEAAVARLIDEAFDNLDAVIADNLDTNTAHFRTKIADVLREESTMRWLAKGSGEQPGRWGAMLLTIEGKDRTAARHLKNALKEEAKKLSTSGTRETRMKDMTERGLLPPPAYVVRDDGVWEENGENIATRPIYIVGRGMDIVRESERFVRLRWAEDADRSTELIIDRASAMDSRGLQRQAAAAGAPVTSANALALTRYLDAFETMNVGSLPMALVTNRLGWQPNGSFMLGAQCVGPETVELVDDHRAADWKVGGDWDGWIRAYEMVNKMPLMVMAVIASVSAPLLQILDAKGFVVDWSGETSVGKTSALRMAASVWGVPDAEAAAGPMGSWKSASTAGPLAAAAFRHSLPMILDDTKEGKPEVVAQLLYQIPSGRDFSRATREGAEREPRTWRTVLLSSGEASILSFSRDGGARARTIGLQGPPMGKPSPVNAGRAEHVKDLLNANHGHLGERVISELMGRPDHYRVRFGRHRTKRTSGLSGADARIATYLAVLDTARELAEAAGMPVPQCDPVGFAAECVESTRDNTDPPTEALRALYVWSSGNPHRFEGRTATRHDPTQGYIGVWRQYEWDEIAFVPQFVEELLRQWRYDANAILESWSRRGWRRMTGKKRGANPKVVFGPGGDRPRMLVVTKAALKAIDHETDNHEEGTIP